MIRKALCSVLVVALAGCATTGSKTAPPAQSSTMSTPSDTSAQVEAAKRAAESWLELVDQGQYPASWDAAAKAFQKAVSRDNWTSAAAAAREPFGKRLSRQLRSAEYKTHLPGAPDGKYVVIQFDTAFEKKAQAVETVTPMQEDDGTWHVSGYFIR